MKCACVQDNGPDSAFSWVTLASGVFIFLTVGGIINSHGVLFVQILEVYGTNREQASWVFSINVIVRTLVGVIAGMLLHNVDINKISIFGSVVSSFGLMFCYLAKRYLLLIVSFGVLRGIGDGVLFVVANHAVVMHFSKWRTTAVGILLVSMSLGTFIYVALMEYLLASYGLRGMFLVLGAVNANMIPAGLLLRTPSWMSWKHGDEMDSLTKGVGVVVVVKPLKAHKDSEISVDQGDVPSKRNLLGVPTSGAQDVQEVLRSGYTECANGQVDSSEYSSHQAICLQRGPDWSRPSVYSKVRSTLLDYCLIFRTPLFLLMTVITVPYIYYYMTYVKVIVDVGIDHGLSAVEAAYLMSFFSAGNIFGRPFFSLAIDQFGLQPKVVCAVCFLVMSAGCFVLPFGDSFHVQASLAVVFGLLDGAIMPILTSAVPEYVGIALNPMALATLYFIAGMLGLTRPAFTGYFRDMMGSYDGIFYTFGGCFIVCCLAWMFEPRLMRLAKKTNCENSSNFSNQKTLHDV